MQYKCNRHQNKIWVNRNYSLAFYMFIQHSEVISTLKVPGLCHYSPYQG